ncbi:hypothetical protein PBI_RHYNO_63 [Mycobacterium phage RhynO]|uniref:Uncharacterized protein n=2 Tax=Fromanvirus twister TaxID=1993863 RepID=H9NCN6_9CAUD|nr:hypothetical protein CG97_gp19 [Mycobacterium phage RhynO]YP_009607533.1 hypothetical protein FDI09_gp33 [Mycobacterium phage Twister]QGJ94764.1 hypothetical protein SEA_WALTERMCMICKEY_62 [Mycobacterium phage WalterMcMickey]QLF84480.1 hypothetical protein SEA_TOPANGA_60 [Mycobacterium phage Topanga]AFF28357.1 hypothetical protein TWISTER_62 [Mycobacterium phage Twister]AHJ88721.1 hypothetical protein PBI_RHYNO_63 [Mycobacterium phage RhynO]
MIVGGIIAVLFIWAFLVMDWTEDKENH